MGSHIWLEMESPVPHLAADPDYCNAKHPKLQLECYSGGFLSFNDFVLHNYSELQEKMSHCQCAVSWKDEWMNGWVDGWIEVCEDGWIEGWKNGWKDG